jgi:DNA polymerase III sliding clamp (beta) subunit (PCNA family)
VRGGLQLGRKEKEEEDKDMQTQERETVTDTVSVKAIAVIELLEGASTHADKGKDALRALSSVQISGKSGHLMARATDRYRAIEGEIEGEGGDLAASLVALDDVKRVISLAKDSKAALLTFTRVANLLTVSVSGSAITIQLLDDNYPPSFDDLFNKGEVTPISKVSFNPAFFADYAKVAGKGKPVTIEFKGEKMAMTIGLTGDKVTWRALLMPMRII